MQKIKNGIILMGKDTYNFDRTLSKLTQDKELYLDFINKFDIELFGKKVGRIFFEEYDQSKLLPQDIIVIGSKDDSLNEYFDGLTRNYIVMEQGNSRFHNVLLAKQNFELKGLTYITGADLPQIKNIDERINTFADDKIFSFDICPIEDFGPFWRMPFVLNMAQIYNPYPSLHIFGNRGFKEAQDYLAHIEEIDLERMTSLNPGTKLNNPKVLAKLILSMIKIVPTKSIKSIPTLASNGYRALYVKSKLVTENGYTMPEYKSAEGYGIFDAIAKILVNIPNGMNDARIGISNNVIYYKDLDSLEDAYRHVKEMYQKNNSGNIEFETIEQFIGFNKKPLIEHNEIRKLIDKGYGGKNQFYDNLRRKEKIMKEFTDTEKIRNYHFQPTLSYP